MTRVVGVSVRPTTEQDKDLPAFDNTKLTAINTCPKWGLIRYEHHKVFDVGSRRMALEAGSACHDFFAAVRLYQLGFKQGLHDHMHYHGIKQFGGERWKQMIDILKQTVFDKTDGLNMGLECLQSGGFFDDPQDKRRTMSNLEEACIGYFDRWNFDGQEVFVLDPSDPTSFVGCENTFDCVVEFTLTDSMMDGGLTYVESYRFIGKIDGVHVRKDNGNIRVEENKTASRLNEAWSMSFDMAHQVTGYMVAMSAMLSKVIREAVVHGLTIPRPRNGVDAVVRVDVRRNDFQIEQWASWFYHTIEIWKRYKDVPIDAPTYTHSCNRYFTACTYIPLCSSPKEDQLNIFENEMMQDEWSPLNH